MIRNTDVNIELAILKNKQDGEYGPPPPSSEPVSSPPKKEFYDPPPPPHVDSTNVNPPQVATMDTSVDPNSNPVKMVQEMVGRVKVNIIIYFIINSFLLHRI